MLKGDKKKNVLDFVLLTWTPKEKKKQKLSHWNFFQNEFFFSFSHVEGSLDHSLRSKKESGRFFFFLPNWIELGWMMMMKRNPSGHVFVVDDELTTMARGERELNSQFVFDHPLTGKCLSGA